MSIEQDMSEKISEIVGQKEDARPGSLSARVEGFGSSCLYEGSEAERDEMALMALQLGFSS